mgnify:CR=1 FL=1
MPAEAVLLVHLAPTGAQLKNAEALRARFEAVPEIKKAIAEAEGGIAKEQNITWAADIQP